MFVHAITPLYMIDWESWTNFEDMQSLKWSLQLYLIVYIYEEL